MEYLIGTVSNATPKHKHRNYEIIYYAEGCGTVCTGDRTFSISAGQIMIVTPGTTHEALCDGEFKRYYISGDLSRYFALSAPALISDNPQKDGLFFSEMLYKNRNENPEYVSALVNAYMHFLMQSIKTDTEIAGIIRTIADTITDTFYDSKIDLTLLLQKSGYAEDYIRAAFKKHTGKTPTRFLTETRIRHACFLIDTYKKTLALSEIAEKCGYTDYVYFSRRFKEIMGLSPKKYAAL